MSQSEYRARQVGAKTNQVIDYHRDDGKPGKPLFLMIPGGLIALAALALIIFIGYQTWSEKNIAENLGITLIIILAPFYVGGVFLFSYGYELYNLPRALRLTAIIVFVTLAAVVIVAVLFLALGSMGGKSGSSNNSKSSSRSSSAAKVSANKSSVGGLIGGAAGAIGSKSSSNSSSSGGHYYGGGNVFLGGLGGGGTRVETREVTKEVVKEVPKEPMPITCPFCTRSYVPVEHKFICPSCGAATPKELIEESQMPKE